MHTRRMLALCRLVAISREELEPTDQVQEAELTVEKMVKGTSTFGRPVGVVFCLHTNGEP
jgi:hypothetical protein